MALNAEVGSETANSYVTLEEATAYFENRTHTDSWDSFVDKEPALITASQMIDWYVTFKGYKSSESQSMKWPRTGVYRKDGTEVADNIIPSELKTSVYELALSSLDEDRTADNELLGLERIKASSLEIKANFDDEMDTIPEKIWRILSDLTASGSINVVRLIRA